jgi:hypothetical protein
MSSSATDVAAGGDGKRKGRDILEKYSFRKVAKLDEKLNTETKSSVAKKLH